MSDARLPPSLRRRDDRASIFEDVEPYLGRETAELSRMLSELCRSAVASIDATPEGRRTLDFVDRRSAASERLWLDLVGRRPGA